MAPTRTPFANTQNTLTVTPTAPHRRQPPSHRQSPASPYKKKGQDKAKDALTRSQKKHLKVSDESPIVPRAREYGVPRHLKNVKSSPQHAPFDARAPPTADAIRRAERRVREQNAGRLDDMLLGQAIVSALGPGLDRVPGRVVFGDDAVRKYCKATGLNQHLTDDERDVMRFELPDSWERRRRAQGRPLPPPRTDLELPVVCMNNANAFGVDTVLTGQHGFAWMVTPECSELDKLGPFHLFNNPGPLDNWKIRNWHYCGRYYAHRTGRQMLLDGWRKLPQETKDVGMAINVDTPGGLRVELVILQFCGLPDWTVWGKLNEAAANCVRPAKPPGAPLNRLALVRLFAKHGQDLVDEHAHMQAIRMTGRHEPL